MTLTEDARPDWRHDNAAYQRWYRRHAPIGARPMVPADLAADLEAFRAWLTARRYAHGTTNIAVADARMALLAGCNGPEGVDAAFPEKRSARRGDIRGALRKWEEYRREAEL